MSCGTLRGRDAAEIARTIVKEKKKWKGEREFERTTLYMTCSKEVCVI